MSLSRSFLLPFLALLTVPAFAQQGPGDEAPEDETWYRVELIIFANRDPEAALAEAWPPLPDLTYPEAWRSLEDGEPDEPATREFALRRVEDTVPEPFELYWDRSVESLLEEYDRQQSLRQPDIRLEPLVELTAPRPFVALPADARELNAQRSRIANSAGLDVLFHESWLQRIESREKSVPLLMDAGPRFGDYPELQGSVRLYSGRYLHIATHLWLNTAGSYLDIAGGDWRMPPPPLPPVRVLPEFKPFQVTLPPGWFSVTPAIGEDMAGAFEESPPTSGDRSGNAGGEAAAMPGVIVIPRAAATEDAQERLHAPASDEEMRAFLAEPVRNYDFRHAVLVAQQRRMRSGELHYIDHPLLGIVIKISRYEFEPFVTPAEDPGPAGAR